MCLFLLTISSQSLLTIPATSCLGFTIRQRTGPNEMQPVRHANILSIIIVYNNAETTPTVRVVSHIMAKHHSREIYLSEQSDGTSGNMINAPVGIKVFELGPT